MVSLEIFPYLYGRLNFHISSAICIIQPTIGIFIIACPLIGITRLFYNRTKHSFKKRFLIITEICIQIVLTVLLIKPSLIPYGTSLRPPAKAFLYGFRDRIRNRADISAIRNWLKTLDKEDYDQHQNYVPYDQLPKSLKALKSGIVHLSYDKQGNPYVRILSGGGFSHWGVTIGMEDMEISESDLSFHYDLWLLVEPGVYIYLW
jgi:hypothetical protein